MKGFVKDLLCRLGYEIAPAGTAQSSRERYQDVTVGNGRSIHK